ncbi:MAG: hypothetical protein GXO87_03790 [Chlorobi bacterium]|nr:hypothetical protein [Chlorobiota bacterium]
MIALNKRLSALFPIGNDYKNAVVPVCLKPGISCGVLDSRYLQIAAQKHAGTTSKIEI